MEGKIAPLCLLCATLLTGCAEGGLPSGTISEEGASADAARPPAEDEDQPGSVMLPADMVLTIVDAAVPYSNQFVFNNEGCVLFPESCPVRPLLRCVFDAVKHELHIEGTLHPASSAPLCDPASGTITVRVVAYETSDNTAYRLGSLCVAASVPKLSLEWRDTESGGQTPELLAVLEVASGIEFYFYAALEKTVTVEADGFCGLN